MLPFKISFNDGQPAFGQLVQAVRRAILSGQLKDGDSFPSVRSLSVELKISPTTAHKAVSQLKQEGLLASRPGVGMVVRTGQLPNKTRRLEMLKPLATQLVSEATALQLKPADLNTLLTQLWK